MRIEIQLEEKQIKDAIEAYLWEHGLVPANMEIQVIYPALHRAVLVDETIGDAK